MLEITKTIDLTKRKVLLIFLNDNTGNQNIYVTPQSLEKISEFAVFEEYIPIFGETVFVEDGIEEHAFEIYNDLARRNVYYLVQNFPFATDQVLDLIPKKDVVEYNTNAVVGKSYYEVILEIRDWIAKKFDVFIVMRFRFDMRIPTTVFYTVSKDLAGRIPVVFTGVRPVPNNFPITLTRNQILSPSLALYFFLPRSKVFYDFSINLSKIARFINNEVTYIVRPMDYLDDFYESVFNTLFPVESGEIPGAGEDEKRT